MVVAIRKFKRYLEYKFQRGVVDGWHFSDGSAMMKLGANRDVSSMLCQLFYGSNMKKIVNREHFVLLLFR